MSTFGGFALVASTTALSSFTSISLRVTSLSARHTSSVTRSFVASSAKVNRVDGLSDSCGSVSPETEYHLYRSPAGAPVTCTWMSTARWKGSDDGDAVSSTSVTFGSAHAARQTASSAAVSRARGGVARLWQRVIARRDEIREEGAPDALAR